jgi:hypothetical protein
VQITVYSDVTPCCPIEVRSRFGGKNHPPLKCRRMVEGSKQQIDIAASVVFVVSLGLF